MTPGALLALRSVDYFDELERAPYDGPVGDPRLDDGSLAPQTLRIDTTQPRRTRWLIWLGGVLGLAFVLLATQTFLNNSTTRREYTPRPIAKHRGSPRQQGSPTRQLIPVHTKTRTVRLARRTRRPHRAYATTIRAAPGITPAEQSEPASVSHTNHPHPPVSYSEATANDTRDFGYLGR